MSGRTDATPASPRLLSELSRIRSVLGPAAIAELTYRKIFRDNPLNTTPAVVETKEGRTIVISASDSAATKEMDERTPVVVWGNYFTWDDASPTRPPNFAEAVRSIVGDQRIQVENGLPHARYAALARTGPVAVEAPGAAMRAHVYRKSRAQIEAQWNATRRSDAALIERYVGSLRHGGRLNEAMRAELIGFKPLDALLKEAGLGAVLITSPFTAELFTGLPEEAIRQHGIRCVYQPGQDDILVLAANPITRGDFLLETTEQAWTDAIARRVPSGALGFESAHLSIGEHLQLALKHDSLADAGPLLRRWQDKRAGDDLAYFIVAANGVMHGLAAAFEFIDRHIGGALTEHDARCAFDQGVADFAESVGFGDRVIPSFDVIHSGERTLLPAIAGPYPLSLDNETIKFDMGLLARDSFGCIRACSDIARTWCRDTKVRKAHDALRAALVDHLIPSMRPGMTGAEIHRLGVIALASAEPALSEADFMPRSGKVDGYTRDCGHTLHRTTAGSVYFVPNAKGVVEPRMLGCVEYVWPLRRRILAVEDAYFVTETDVIPFTVQGTTPCP